MGGGELKCQECLLPPPLVDERIPLHALRQRQLHTVFLLPLHQLERGGAFPPLPSKMYIRVNLQREVHFQGPLGRKVGVLTVLRHHDGAPLDHLLVANRAGEAGVIEVPGRVQMGKHGAAGGHRRRGRNGHKHRSPR